MAMYQYERGCLPCTNCLAVVPQDKWFAVERFGGFQKILEPGLNVTGCDVGGCCITMRSVTNRVNQLSVNIQTKTKDNVFVTVIVAVQLQVNPSSAQDAMYKLADVNTQVDSYVSDVVRSEIPKMVLDEAFEKKDTISQAVQEYLSEHMLGYGFRIHKALVTELQVNRDVMQSMNEINKQKRLWEAAIMAAEADKIRIVKAAEADADAACLAGEGIARQRAAIVDGLRQSLTAGDEKRGVKSTEIAQLLLTTQYFETLRDIGASGTCKAYFLPDTDPEDTETQIRTGMLQAEAALEGMHGPVTETYPGSNQSTPRTPPQSHSPDRFGHQTSFHDPFPPSPAPPPQQMMRPPPQPRATMMQITVPAGVQAGQQLQVQAPDGRMVLIQVPYGVTAGQLLQIQV